MISQYIGSLEHFTEVFFVILLAKQCAEKLCKIFIYGDIGLQRLSAHNSLSPIVQQNALAIFS